VNTAANSTAPTDRLSSKPGPTATAARDGSIRDSATAPMDRRSSKRRPTAPASKRGTNRDNLTVPMEDRLWSLRGPTAPGARNGANRACSTAPPDRRVVETRADGYRREEWFKEGQRDRADGPAVVETWADGYRCEAWYEQGRIDRGRTGCHRYPGGWLPRGMVRTGPAHTRGNSSQPERDSRCHIPAATAGLRCFPEVSWESRSGWLSSRAV